MSASIHGPLSSCVPANYTGTHMHMHACLLANYSMVYMVTFVVVVVPAICLSELLTENKR